MKSSEEDPNLPLGAWKLQPPRDPEFRTRVWGRIEAKPASSWPRYARTHPTAVASALALAIALGAAGGREQARARTEADRNALAAGYVQSLDARLMVMDEGARTTGADR